MSRMVFALPLLLMLVGCRSGFNPFGMRNSSTRVPPPPTGAVGDSFNYDDYDSVPRPSVDQSSATWPARDYAPQNELANRTSPQRTTSANASLAADLPPSLRASDDPTWLDPNAPVGSGARRTFPPNRIATPTNTQPLVVTPPRIRGFPNAGRQEIYVPNELAQYQNQPVRQASNNGVWESRY